MKVPEGDSAMDMDALVNELAAGETRYKTAKADVERLRQDMALAKCPFKEGQTIELTKNGKDYSGIVAFFDGRAACDLKASNGCRS